MKTIYQLRRDLAEKTLTPAELKKREEIAQAIERENPGIDKSKKMAIATAQAKKVAEEIEINEEDMPTGIKTYHKNKGTGKESWTVNFTAKAAADHEKELKKAGHTITGRALMFGSKEGERRNVTEEVDVLDESRAHKILASSMRSKASWGNQPEAQKQKLRDALDRHTEKALAANKAGDDEAVKVHQGYINTIKTKMAKLARNESVEKEETLDEADVKVGSHVTLHPQTKGGSEEKVKVVFLL